MGWVRFETQEAVGDEGVRDALHRLPRDAQPPSRVRHRPVTRRNDTEQLPSGLCLAHLGRQLLPTPTQEPSQLVHVGDQQRDVFHGTNLTLTTCCRSAIVGRVIDLYSMPHKALRHALAVAGVMLGADDPEAVEVVHSVLDDLAAHGRHEDEFIHPVLGRHLPALLVDLDSQHGALTAAIDENRRALDGASRVDAYRTFQRLVAANLVHLDHEESVVLPALWARVPAAELADVLAAFKSAHPEAHDVYVRWSDALTSAELHLIGL